MVTSKFIYQEVGGITANGERIVKPRFVGTRQVSTQELIQEVAKRTAVSRGQLLGMLMNIADALPAFLAQGHSVKIDGIGVFHPQLTMRDEMPVSEQDETGDEVVHNARNVVFDTVRFVPDKGLVSGARAACRPIHDRYAGNREAMPTPYSEEERRDLALNHLQEHSALTVSQYMQLTGLRRTKASQELRLWSHGEDACLEAVGRPPHRYYVVRHEG